MGQAKRRGNRDTRVQQAQFRAAQEIAVQTQRQEQERLADEQFAAEVLAAMPKAHQDLELIRRGKRQAMGMLMDETPEAT